MVAWSSFLDLPGRFWGGVMLNIFGFGAQAFSVEELDWR
jgi:hypothetical protein